MTAFACFYVCNTVITVPAKKILPVLRYYRDLSTILYCGDYSFHCSALVLYPSQTILFRVVPISPSSD